jgi:hypothetical protein
MAASLEPVAGVGVTDRDREQAKAEREQGKVEHERLLQLRTFVQVGDEG